MADLKAHVEDLAVNILNKSNVKVLCAKADMFSCSKLVEACARLMVKEGISLDKEEVKKMPDAATVLLNSYKAEADQKKVLEMMKVAELDAEVQKLEAEVQKLYAILSR